MLPVDFPNVILARILTTGGVNRADRRARGVRRGPDGDYLVPQRRSPARVFHGGRITVAVR